MMACEYFRVRRLIWDDMKQHVKPSEERELRGAIGNQLIDENQVSLVCGYSSVRGVSKCWDTHADVVLSTV